MNNNSSFQNNLEAEVKSNREGCSESNWGPGSVSYPALKLRALSHSFITAVDIMHSSYYSTVNPWMAVFLSLYISPCFQSTDQLSPVHSELLVCCPDYSSKPCYCHHQKSEPCLREMPQNNILVWVEQMQVSKSPSFSLHGCWNY